MTGAEAIELIRKNVWTGRKPGLSRTEELLNRLGNPHQAMKYVHITGTNGKGSTAAMTAAILTRAGVRAGLFTSPHLWTFHERFCVDGQPIPDEALARLTQQALEAGADMEDKPTEFELMTAVGLLYFREANCELVVLEVGLGGRLDSTNVIPAPEVAAITNIGLEHTAELGNTKTLIAGEKSGIIKPGCHVVLYHQDREVETVVEQACRDCGAPLHKTKPEAVELMARDLEGQTFRYGDSGPYHIRLLGEHQLWNASVALEIVNALRQRGWTIPEQAVQEGLEQTAWPARMELVRRKPDVILDGGHNPQCMEALSRGLRQLYPEQKLWFLTGVLADKDYGSMCASLIPLAKGFVTITPDSPRALSAQALADYLKGQGMEAVPCADTQEGLDRVLSLAGPEDAVCVCGSLYMIGEVRHLLGLC